MRIAPSFIALMVFAAAACSKEQVDTDKPAAFGAAAAAEAAPIVAAEITGAKNVIVSEAPSDLAITIYRDDLALITETRKIILPEGRSKIEFEGVSDQMIAQSALLAEFGAITIERNFDYDLLAQQSLFSKSVGKNILLTRTDPEGGVTQISAKIIAADRGVLLEIDGKIEAFKCAGLPERGDFYDMPENLKAKPTLSLQVNAEKAGEQELTISYLASGFSWAADYVMTLDGKPDDKGHQTASLAGWLTLTNGTAISFENAPTAIIAGDLRRLSSTRRDTAPAPYFYASCWPQGSTKTGSQKNVADDTSVTVQRAYFAPPAAAMSMEPESLADKGVAQRSMKTEAEREDFGDYKLYRVPNLTTVAAQQTKQISFLKKEGVELEKKYAFHFFQPTDYQGSFLPASVEYHLDNDKDGKLAEPLPEGTFRIMTKMENDKAFFLGQDYEKDLAVGLPVEITAGRANDVILETRVISQSQDRNLSGASTYIREMAYDITNASPMPAHIKITLGRDSGYSYKISQETISLDKNEDIPTWEFTVPAESRKTLQFTAQYK